METLAGAPWENGGGNREKRFDCGVAAVGNPAVGKSRSHRRPGFAAGIDTNVPGNGFRNHWYADPPGLCRGGAAVGDFRFSGAGHPLRRDVQQRNRNGIRPLFYLSGRGSGLCGETGGCESKIMADGIVGGGCLFRLCTVSGFAVRCSMAGHLRTGKSCRADSAAAVFVGGRKSGFAVFYFRKRADHLLLQHGFGQKCAGNQNAVLYLQSGGLCI